MRAQVRARFLSWPVKSGCRLSSRRVTVEGVRRAMHEDVVFTRLMTPAGQAADLVPAVYEELRRLASQMMARRAPGQTLQATALVHEAFLRLSRVEPQPWQSPAHFYAAAAEAMRRILIDQARRKGCLRRGGGQQRLCLDDVQLALDTPEDHLLAMDEALTKLAAEDR